MYGKITKMILIADLLRWYSDRDLDRFKLPMGSEFIDNYTIIILNYSLKLKGSW
jgi:hypothetical protein